MTQIVIDYREYKELVALADSSGMKELHDKCAEQSYYIDHLEAKVRELEKSWFKKLKEWLFKTSSQIR